MWFGEYYPENNRRTKMSKSVRITRAIKASIMANVREKVREQYLDSNFGFEYEKAKRPLINRVRTAYSDKYPLLDIEILRRYSCINTFQDYVTVCRELVDSNRSRYFLNTSSMFYEPSAASLLSVKFPFNIAFPYSVGFTSELNSYFLDEEGQEILKEFWEIADKANCEYMALIGGYEERIKIGSTTGSLLKKFPKMEKFLPEIKFDEKPEDESTEKMLKLFEEE